MFSTALPAIATITSPAKAWEMCRIEIAGPRPLTNQSETNAEAVPATIKQREGQPEREPRAGPGRHQLGASLARLRQLPLAGVRVRTSVEARSPERLSERR